MVDSVNGDGGTGLNYFNIVRPVQQGRAANQRLQKELRSFEATASGGFGGGQGLTDRNASAITTGRLPETGHFATFGDLGGRFGTGTGTGGGAAGGRGGNRNNFASQPSGGLGIVNNTLRGNATPNGILGGR